MAREKCPGCGDLTLLPVAYGMPLPGDFDEPDVIFAGCVIPPIMLDELVECEREECSWSGGLLDGERVGSLILSAAAHLDITSSIDGGEIVPFDELERIAVEIALGWSWGDPRTRVPDTTEHRDAWTRIDQLVDDLTAAN